MHTDMRFHRDTRLRQFVRKCGLDDTYKRWRRKAIRGRGKLFENVTVVPFEALLSDGLQGHQFMGGPIWPDWNRQTMARFNQGRNPKDSLPNKQEALRHYSGNRYAWIGPIYRHFGHGIAEFCTRMAYTLEALDKPTLVFAMDCKGSVAELEATPTWFKQLLAWYGVDAEQVVLVNEPTHFDYLHVFPQGEQLPDVGPRCDYLQLLGELTERNLSALPDLGEFPRMSCQTIAGRASNITYVSRARMIMSFAGEAYLEEILSEAGVNVFRPESHGLRKQLAVYATSPRLIFAEGSAIHGTQLLGRSLNEVTVLMRRPEERFGEAFLRPRARQVTYISCLEGLICGETSSGVARLWTGMPIFNEAKLVDWISQLGLDVQRSWNSTRFCTQVRKDIQQWLGFQATQHHTISSRQTIYRTMSDLGFPSLVGEAKSTIEHVPPNGVRLTK
jgi:hypothetical protein